MKVLCPLFTATQQFDRDGQPLAGGLLHTYIASSTTPALTFTDQSGDVQNTNPIELDSSGYVEQPIWLTSGAAYKFVLTDANGDVMPNGTVDNVSFTIGGGTNAYLPLTGGTLSGPLVLSADPTAPLQAATKQYVDNAAPTVEMSLPWTNSFVSGTTVVGLNDWAYFDVALDSESGDIGEWIDTDAVSNFHPTDAGWYQINISLTLQPTANPGTANAVIGFFGTGVSVIDDFVPSITQAYAYQFISGTQSPEGFFNSYGYWPTKVSFMHYMEPGQKYIFAIGNVDGPDSSEFTMSNPSITIVRLAKAGV